MLLLSLTKLLKVVVVLRERITRTISVLLVVLIVVHVRLVHVSDVKQDTILWDQLVTNAFLIAILVRVVMDVTNVRVVFLWMIMEIVYLLEVELVPLWE